MLADFTEWAARTGMRKGEISKLKWSGYDAETGVLRLRVMDSRERSVSELDYVEVAVAGEPPPVVIRRPQRRKA